jgi:hypothetical protein
MHTRINFIQTRFNVTQTRFDLRETRFDLRNSRSDLRNSRSDLRQSSKDLRQSRFDLTWISLDLPWISLDLPWISLDLTWTSFDLIQTGFNVVQTRFDLSWTRFDLIQTWLNVVHKVRSQNTGFKLIGTDSTSPERRRCGAVGPRRNPYNRFINLATPWMLVNIGLLGIGDDLAATRACAQLSFSSACFGSAPHLADVKPNRPLAPTPKEMLRWCDSWAPCLDSSQLRIL